MDPAPDTYAGFSRFELELEFVQLLAVPQYLHHLATSLSTTSADTPTKLFEDPAFLAYLDYLQYWKRPEYAKFLSYPEPTLRHLELLQKEKFRKDMSNVEAVAKLIEGGVRAANGDPSNGE